MAGNRSDGALAHQVAAVPLGPDIDGDLSEKMAYSPNSEIMSCTSQVSRRLLRGLANSALFDVKALSE